MLAALTLVLCVGNLTFTFLRSTIPFELDGRVNDIVFITEKHPGLDDIFVITIGDRDIRVDPDIAREIDVGDHVRKDAWSTEMVISEEDSERALGVQPSRDFNRMVVVMPVIALAVAVLLYLPRPTFRASGGSGSASARLGLESREQDDLS